MIRAQKGRKTGEPGLASLRHDDLDAENEKRKYTRENVLCCLRRTHTRSALSTATLAAPPISALPLQRVRATARLLIFSSLKK